MAGVLAMALAACGTSPPETATSSPTPDPSPEVASPHEEASFDSVRMPNLVGLPSAEAWRQLGEIEASARLNLTSNWVKPRAVRCDARPGTVVRQQPAPGVLLRRRAGIEVQTAGLDLAAFRGPCEPARGDLGPVSGPDAVLARQFYRFAADPSLGAPFAPEDVWVGIEHGPRARTLAGAQLADLSAWTIDSAGYAERSGPLSALDLLASSGGYFELHPGVVRSCPSGEAKVPPELSGLRAVTLTPAPDTVEACMQWWGVTLFLDGEDLIRGVALRLGSP